MEELYPHLMQLINLGYEIQINGQIGRLKICSICYGGEVIALFGKRGRKAPVLPQQLEEYAAAYLIEGWVNDEVNGERYQIDL